MRLGNIFECLAFYPEAFDDSFIVAKKPEGKGADIIDQIVKDRVDLPNMTNEQISKYCWDFHSNRSLESRHGELMKLIGYYESLTSGKEVVDKKLVEQCQKKLEQTDLEFLRQGSIFQEWIEFEFMGEKCKALIDVLNSKWYDLKTTSKSLTEFPKSVLSYGYDVQAYWYNEAIQYKYPGVEWGGYYVVPFTQEPARLYKWNIDIAKDKVEYLVDMYKWHRDNNVWYDASLHESTLIDGVKWINL